MNAMPLLIHSPLSAELEALVTRIIGAVIEVHRQLGPGLIEGQYEDALMIELEAQRFAVERQRTITIIYRGYPLRPQRIDLVVENQVLVEVKAVERLMSVHQSQVISYLRATGLRIGLLVNFNEPVARIKRVIL
jgi:GxxExxY protein